MRIIVVDFFPTLVIQSQASPNDYRSAKMSTGKLRSIDVSGLSQTRLKGTLANRTNVP